MKITIRNNIQKCSKCGPTGREPMVITDTPRRPFEKVYMDMVGPLPTTTMGNKYILTLQDDLSKFFVCAAMPDAEAEIAARVFYNEIVTKYGIPLKLVTDIGTNFTSKLFGSVCKLLRIKKQHITPYHPQANGSLERVHRPLADYLRSFAKEDGRTVVSALHHYAGWLERQAVVWPDSTRQRKAELDKIHRSRSPTPSLSEELKSTEIPSIVVTVCRKKPQVQGHEWANCKKRLNTPHYIECGKYGHEVDPLCPGGGNRQQGCKYCKGSNHTGDNCKINGHTGNRFCVPRRQVNMGNRSYRPTGNGRKPPRDNGTIRDNRLRNQIRGTARELVC
ncbi:Retrovirus-related Pol polyprotein from transposon 412 [Eumeta japonica]|uniref:Retrovirus-related Pol polyprotein from transposon 412 n=1 Tax=Eumeta variegata TaxID=151549 RepID=A0A4C1SSV4_EUMVA|nr:Retrovirus-related Pol polyprotein from transposon 412 [Eumeta japonica]